MTHAANVLGFSLGMARLTGLPLLAWLPAEQFTRLSALGCVILAICSAITCIMTPEAPPEHAALTGPDSPGRIARIQLAFRSVVVAARSLPVSIRRICFAQFASWLGWFSSLFLCVRADYTPLIRQHDRLCLGDLAPRTPSRGG